MCIHGSLISFCPTYEKNSMKNARLHRLKINSAWWSGNHILPPPHTMWQPLVHMFKTNLGGHKLFSCTAEHLHCLTLAFQSGKLSPHQSLLQNVSITVCLTLVFQSFGDQMCPPLCHFVYCSFTLHFPILLALVRDSWHFWFAVWSEK